MSRRLARGALALLAALGALGSTRPAAAAATFQLEVADGPGVGFNDERPATPVGGNTGTTVGAQRRQAFQFALDLWGKVLDSPIPIRVVANFGPLECTATNAVLGQAGPAAMEFDVPGQDPNVVFPEALADRLAGVDIRPGFPDIQAEFNGSLPECFPGMDWYYGLDAAAFDDKADLIMTILHEIAHGLGFLSTVDETTGELLNPGTWDPFTAKLLDAATNKHWDAMTPAELLTSMATARGLVWDGQFGNAAAAMWLTPGAPRIRTTPEVPGLRDALIDTNAGRPLAMAPVMGMVALPTPPDQCDLVAPMTGLIAVLPETDCHPLNQLAFVEEAGAIAGIVVTEREPPPALDQSPEDLAIINTTLPVVGMMKADADRLLGATGVTVELYADAMRRTGTDAMGRVYIFASQPVTTSSGSHIDPAVRPDAVMEPSQTAQIHHDITLERAMLRDIGWGTTCGNGMPDAGEECDSGSANSDSLADACRTSCLMAKCGDNVVDTGEQCDSRLATTPCNPNCTLPVCGDGVVSQTEECDNGMSNSNATPDACRTTCKRASCGDGVVDSGESCDDMLTPATCQQCRVLMGTGGGAGASSTGGTGGSATGGGAGMSPNTGGANPMGAGATGGGGEDDPGKKATGCGCQLPGAADGGGSAWALVAGALSLVAARTRRRRIIA